MSFPLWQQCLARLRDELPTTEFNMWIHPLQVKLSDNTLALYTSDHFILDRIWDRHLDNISGLLTSFCGANTLQLRFEIGIKPVTQMLQVAVTSSVVAPIQMAQT